MDIHGLAVGSNYAFLAMTIGSALTWAGRPPIPVTKETFDRKS